MKPEELARAGLWLLRQAVLSYLADHPGATGSEVRDELGLNQDRDRHGGHRFHLFWGLGNLLEQEGEVVNRDGRLFLPSQLESPASSV
jgi:hypothetical protein